MKLELGLAVLLLLSLLFASSCESSKLKQWLDERNKQHGKRRQVVPPASEPQYYYAPDDAPPDKSLPYYVPPMPVAPQAPPVPEAPSAPQAPAAPPAPGAPPIPGTTPSGHKKKLTEKPKPTFVKIRTTELKSIPEGGLFDAEPPELPEKIEKNVVATYEAIYCAKVKEAPEPGKTEKEEEKKKRISFMKDNPKRGQAYDFAIKAVTKALGIKGAEKGKPVIDTVGEMVKAIEEHDPAISKIDIVNIETLIPKDEYEDAKEAADNWFKTLPQTSDGKLSTEEYNKLGPPEQYIWTIKSKPGFALMLEALIREANWKEKLNDIGKSLDKLLPSLIKAADFKELDEILVTALAFVRTINKKAGADLPTTMPIAELLKLKDSKSKDGRNAPAFDLMAEVAITNHPGTENDPGPKAFSKIVHKMNIRESSKISLVDQRDELTRVKKGIDDWEAHLSKEDKAISFGSATDKDSFWTKHQIALEKLINDASLYTKDQLLDHDFVQRRLKSTKPYYDKPKTATKDPKIRKKIISAEELLKEIRAHYGDQKILYKPKPDEPGNKAKKSEKLTPEEAFRDIAQVVPDENMKDDNLDAPLFLYVLGLLGNEWEEAMSRNEKLRKLEIREEEKKKKGGVAADSVKPKRVFGREPTPDEILRDKLKSFDITTLKRVPKRTGIHPHEP